MTPPSPCQSPNLGLLFRQIRDAMWARMEREMAATGHSLNFSQYITLKELATGAVGATELARAAHLHPGAMTRLLDKLETRGLLQREADPTDRRALKINLTPAGLAIWNDIQQCAQRVKAQALEGMDDAERDHLMSMLGQVRDNLLAVPPQT